MKRGKKGKIGSTKSYGRVRDGTLKMQSVTKVHGQAYKKRGHRQRRYPLLDAVKERGRTLTGRKIPPVHQEGRKTVNPVESEGQPKATVLKFVQRENPGQREKRYPPQGILFW